VSLLQTNKRPVKVIEVLLAYMIYFAISDHEADRETGENNQ